MHPPEFYKLNPTTENLLNELKEMFPQLKKKVFQNIPFETEDASLGYTTFGGKIFTTSVEDYPGNTPTHLEYLIGTLKDRLSGEFNIDRIRISGELLETFILLHEIGHQVKQLDKLDSLPTSLSHIVRGQVHELIAYLKGRGKSPDSLDDVQAYRELPFEKEADDFAIEILHHFKNQGKYLELFKPSEGPKLQNWYYY